MGPFTFISEWVAQDALNYLLAAAVIVYIAWLEKQAAAIRKIGHLDPAQTAQAAAIHRLPLWWLFGHRRHSEA